MADFPDTVDSLIVQVRDPANRAAWEQFEKLYRPVVFRIARAKGLQHADAVDVVQQVLISVAAAVPHYQKHAEGPRFRNWLSRIARNAILKCLTRRPSDCARGGSEILDILSAVPCADPQTDALLNIEYRREIFRCAAEKVRTEISDVTWLAFELTALQEKSIERVAEHLGIAVGSVYAARSRVMRRIRNAVVQLETGFCEKETS